MPKGVYPRRRHLSLAHRAAISKSLIGNQCAKKHNNEDANTDRSDAMKARWRMAKIAERQMQTGKLCFCPYCGRSLPSHANNMKSVHTLQKGEAP